MFIPFQNEPRLISLPVLASTPDLFYDVELAHAIDASNARTGALHVRLHTRLSANNTHAILMVLAFPILPFDSAVARGSRGPRPSSPPAATASPTPTAQQGRSSSVPPPTSACPRSASCSASRPTSRPPPSRTPSRSPVGSC